MFVSNRSGIPTDGDAVRNSPKPEERGESLGFGEILHASNFFENSPKLTRLVHFKDYSKRMQVC